MVDHFVFLWVVVVVGGGQSLRCCWSGCSWLVERRGNLRSGGGKKTENFPRDNTFECEMCVINRLWSLGAIFIRLAIIVPIRFTFLSIFQYLIKSIFHKNFTNPSRRPEYKIIKPDHGRSELKIKVISCYDEIRFDVSNDCGARIITAAIIIVFFSFYRLYTLPLFTIRPATV